MAYIGLTIGLLGLVASLYFCVAGMKRIGGSLSDTAVNLDRDHTPIPWRPDADNFIWGVIIAFAFGAMGLAIFIYNV